MANSTSSNAQKGRDFQKRAASILGRHFGVSFKEEQPINIGTPPKAHRFDLVSNDLQHVGECKDSAWTQTGNVPSAKMATINEAVFYLQHLPPNVKRFVVMPKRIHTKRRESVAEYYFRTYQHLLSGVTVIEIDLNSGAVREFKV